MQATNTLLTACQKQPRVHHSTCLMSAATLQDQQHLGFTHRLPLACHLTLVALVFVQLQMLHPA